MKKGQVTLFIIIGIILVLAIIAFFYIRGLFLENQKIEDIPTSFQGPSQYIYDCFERNAKQSITYVGVHGGFFMPPKESVDLDINQSEEYSEFQDYPFVAQINDFNALPLWINNGNDISPDLIDVEKELASYVNTNMLFCLTGLKRYTENGYHFKINPSNITTKINDNGVIFILDYPIEMSKDSINFKLERKSFIIENNFKESYSAAKKIIKNIMQNPQIIDFNQLRALNNNVLFYPYNNSIIYEVGNETKIKFATEAY